MSTPTVDVVVLAKLAIPPGIVILFLLTTVVPKSTVPKSTVPKLVTWVLTWVLTWVSGFVE